MTLLLQALKLSWRGLWKQRLYAVVIVLSLAMGLSFSNILIAFAVRQDVGDYEIPSYRALSQRAPLLSLGMLVLLLSLGGIPPLAGFVGKFHLFWAAVADSGAEETNA